MDNYKTNKTKVYLLKLSSEEDKALKDLMKHLGINGTKDAIVRAIFIANRLFETGNEETIEGSQE